MTSETAAATDRSLIGQCIDDSQFAIALALDPSVRGAPQVLPALVQLVVHGAFARPAEKLILKNYGEEATAALEQALSAAKDTKAAVRLRTLTGRSRGVVEATIAP